MTKSGERRLLLNLNHLRDYDRQYWNRLVQNPIESVPIMERALKSVALAVASGSATAELNEDEWYVGFDGSIPMHELNPRSLMASYLSKLVAIEGIVTRGTGLC